MLTTAIDAVYCFEKQAIDTYQYRLRPLCIICIKCKIKKLLELLFNV